MRLGLALGDDPLTNEQRKRKIGQAVAVNMSQLAPPEPKLNPAKSVRPAGHTRPRGYFPHDRLLDALGHASIFVYNSRCSESPAGSWTKHAARSGRRQQDDVGASDADGITVGERRRILHRLEIDERRLIVWSRFTCACSKSHWACVTRNVVDRPTSKRRCSAWKRCSAKVAPARAASTRSAVLRACRAARRTASAA